MIREKEALPEHWADLSKDEKRVLLEMAKGRIWWEELWARMGWLKNAGVVIMAIVLFITWGRDALAQWLGFAIGPKP